jgi:IPT/TIG domain
MFVETSGAHGARPREWDWRRSLIAVLGVVVLSTAMSSVARAGGPRWVTGLPYFSTAPGPGLPVVWYTNHPLYFTDPGDLSSTVNHAAADALVAAAAAVWNVPTSALVLAQGGTLAEHVSGSNVYPTSTGLVFPGDVQAGNYQAIQIAVIYDHDGSVTDTMLGEDASDPSGCRQNAVTESVDSISTSGVIQHAVLVLNGRCTGSAPEQQLQMQYQLMRAFGRVLGLGWSQTNDNVFTSTPVPTYDQAMHWPVMHPIDIICGTYTYQCMPQPFTLRLDDLSALAELYMIGQGQAQAGQTDTLLNASQILGYLSFPNGQGMQGVNVLGRRMRQYGNIPETWYTVSSVSGERYRRSNGNPVTGADTSMNGSMGQSWDFFEGVYEFGRVPIISGDWQYIILETEPINPLYVGEYSVGPYTDNTVVPSGSDPVLLTGIYGSYAIDGWLDLATVGAASTCVTGDGGSTAAAPSTTASTGWWTGTLCGYGHVAWWSFGAKSGRSLTVEVTALDEEGFATSTKAMPVVGVWNATDAPGSLPTVAAATIPFNGEGMGMTSVPVSSTGQNQYRIAIADERGDGRPDYGYQGRVLYADSISPASVGYAGGTVTITGTGFRPGNVVTVNGVAANVTSWTANSIVAVVPASTLLGSTGALVADVAVTDLQTGGSTVMSGALTYSSAPPNVMTLVSAPSGTVYVGDVGTVPFAVKVTSWDGSTPIAGASVVFSTSSGTVQFGACGAASCTVMTNAAGVASTTITPLAAGTVGLSAVGSVGTVSGLFTAGLRVRTVTSVRPVEYVAAGATVGWTPQVMVTDNSGTVAGTLVQWNVTGGAMTLTGSTSIVNGSGMAQIQAMAGPLTAGSQTAGAGCAWAGICAAFTAIGVDAAALRLQIVSGAGQSVGAGATLGPVVLQVTDGAGHPVAGAGVNVYQTVDGAGMECPDRGRCPVAPVYESGVAQVVSDENGLVNIAPLQEMGVAETTNVAAATGTQGFLSLSLQAGQ